MAEIVIKVQEPRVWPRGQGSGVLVQEVQEVVVILGAQGVAKGL